MCLFCKKKYKKHVIKIQKTIKAATDIRSAKNFLYENDCTYIHVDSIHTCNCKYISIKKKVINKRQRNIFLRLYTLVATILLMFVQG